MFSKVNRAKFCVVVDGVVMSSNSSTIKDVYTQAEAVVVKIRKEREEEKQAAAFDDMVFTLTNGKEGKKWVEKPFPRIAVKLIMEGIKQGSGGRFESFIDVKAIPGSRLEKAQREWAGFTVVKGRVVLNEEKEDVPVAFPVMDNID